MPATSMCLSFTGAVVLPAFKTCQIDYSAFIRGTCERCCFDCGRSRGVTWYRCVRSGRVAACPILQVYIVGREKFPEKLGCLVDLQVYGYVSCDWLFRSCSIPMGSSRVMSKDKTIKSHGTDATTSSCTKSFPVGETAKRKRSTTVIATDPRQPLGYLST